jgi:hypothetical protein
VLLVDPSWTDGRPEAAVLGPTVLGPTAALMQLSGPAMLATATGADLREVRAQLARKIGRARREDLRLR